VRHENCDGLTRRESAGAPLRISLLGSLRAVTGPSSQYANDYGCWSYVPFGNRQSQSMSITPCGSNPPLTSWAQYKDAVNGTNNNQVSRTNQNTLQASGKRAFTSKQIVSDYISAKLGAICRSPACVCGERQVVLRVFPKPRWSQSTMRPRSLTAPRLRAPASLPSTIFPWGSTR
jgi:hypothetical protein